MNILPLEVITQIITSGDTSYKLVNFRCCALWNVLIRALVRPVNSFKSVRLVCQYCDLLSIILYKAHRHLRSIIKWSCISGRLDIYSWLNEQGYDSSEAWIGCYWAGCANLLEGIGPTLPLNIRHGAYLAAIAQGHDDIISDWEAVHKEYIKGCMRGDLVLKKIFSQNSSFVKEISADANIGDRYDIYDERWLASSTDVP